MAVVVTDLRNVIDEADAVTNFNTGTFITTDFAEAPGSIAVAYNENTGSIFYNGGTINLDGQLLYLQSSNTALQLTWTTPAHAIHLSDGTNILYLHQSGNDREVFKHSENQVQFQSFVIDLDYLSTKNSNGEITVSAGVFANYTPATTTQIGSYYQTESKALGGGYNCFLDVLRYGNGGLLITGGLTGDRGNFLEVVIEDRSTANGRGLGGIRELTSGTYGTQISLTIGNTGATDTWFDDSNFNLVFENRDISNDKYFIKTSGSTTIGQETHIFWDSATISTAGALVTSDFSGTGVNTLSITNTNFSSLGNNITFASDSFSSGHTITSCIFNGIGQIDAGLVTFNNNSIISSTATGGSLVLSSTGRTANISNISFISQGSGHAILFLSAGTYNFSSFSFEGFTTIDGSTGNEMVYNNSGGNVIINITGGISPSVRNGVGATTTINNNVSVTIGGLNDLTEIRVYANGTNNELAGIEDAIDGTINNRSFTFGLNASTVVDIVIINKLYDTIPPRINGYVVPSTNTSFNVVQLLDPNYNGSGT